jgi:GxxExxY protein
MSENELATIVIGEAIYVHQMLGPGLLESVYENCLGWRLLQKGLLVERQKPIPLVFEGVHMDCGFRCDMIVEKMLLVEVKAVDAIADIHKAQVLTYLKMTNIKLGLLMNFNTILLKDGLKRIVNNL